jgi:hypothetical protein
MSQNTWITFYNSLEKSDQNFIISCINSINVVCGRMSWIINNDKLFITLKAFQIMCPSIKHTITPEFRDASELLLEWNPSDFKLYT